MTCRTITFVHVLSLLLVRLAVTILAYRMGFFALSDDDFSRVVLTQKFAVSPQFDATGSSWLPAPFWFYGAIMRLFGTQLTVTLVSAVASACLCGVLLYATARTAGLGAHVSYVATLLWTLMPVSVFAGASFVPELVTATLCASALVLMLDARPRLALLAGALLTGATLSRYESWAVAVGVTILIGIAWYTLHHGSKETAYGYANHEESVRRASWTYFAAVASCLFGPLIWLVWNHIAYDDAFRFHRRVSSYWFASTSETQPARLHETITYWLDSYPKSLLAEAPEWTSVLTVIAVTMSVSALLTASTRKPKGFARNWWSVVAVCIAVLVLLSVSQSSGGAPTHHPERALLFIWAIGWLLACDVLGASITKAYSEKRPGGHQQHIPTALVAAVIAGVGIAQLIRVVALAPTYGVDRRAHVDIGTWLRRHPGQPVLMACSDYGYFATQAALGPTTPLTVDCVETDPRTTQSCAFDNPARLKQTILTQNTRWLVAQGNHAAVAETLAIVRHRVGGWSILEVVPSAQ